MRTCVAHELPWSQSGVFLASSRLWFSHLMQRKLKKTSETGVLTSRFFTYNWNPVDFPVCRFGYKKIDSRTRFVDVCILKKIVGEA